MALRCSFGLATFMAASMAMASIITVPDCPGPDDAIEVIASAGTVARQPLSLEVTGNAVKLVAQAYDSGFALPPATEVRGVIPPLPIGKYQLQFFLRWQPDFRPGGDPATLLPEQRVESRQFEVHAVPPTCAASSVEIVGPAFASARTGQPYPQAIRLLVKDAHGNPVPNWTLHVSRINSSIESGTNAPRPDMEGDPYYRTLTTGQDGVAVLAAAANEIPGAFQYRATLSQGLRTSSVATFAFYNQPATSSFPDYPVFEFVRQFHVGQTPRAHFFMTGDQAEAAKLDNSGVWDRTGAVFMAHSPGSRSGTSQVCRFYGRPEAGLDSHFFSADAEECAAVEARFGQSWMLETRDAFAVILPDRGSGVCPAGTRPLHRAFNNRTDANHRYALTRAEATAWSSPDYPPLWTLEGYGPDAVVMCLPE